MEGAVEMVAVEWRAPDMSLFVPKEVRERADNTVVRADANANEPGRPI